MPLTFDLSLDDLSTYKGRNPRPNDFDEYWDEGAARMRAVDPNPERIPATFQTDFAACSHFWFTGINGARVHAKLLEPTDPAPGHPGIVMYHGYSGDSGGWLEKLGWVAAGFTVAALDCRGQGGLSEDPGGTKGTTLRGHIVRGLSDEGPEHLAYRSIFLDAAQLAGLVMAMDDVDPDRVGVTGGSQGGGLSIAAAALEPRVKRAAPVFPFLTDYKRTWEMDLTVNAYQELRDWFRKYDPQHKREDAAFARLGYIDVQHLAPRIRAEVLMFTGLMDQICPPSTQFAAYNKITSPKSVEFFPDFGHEALPGSNEMIFEFMQQL